MGVLAAVVVVVTAGALTMPASTMTADVASLPEGAQVPEGYSQQYTAKDEQNGVIVTAYAPEGVVPEGATLTASLLAQDSDEYAAARQAAGATDEEDTGFAAMDISFVDAEGNEVEPTGDVYVNIDAAGILPEDADPESVTVQHLAEDESGNVASVDTVADAGDVAEGVAAVAADDATAVRAAFSTDGFSTFTITWDAGFGFKTPVTVNCSYYDEQGNPQPIEDGTVPERLRRELSSGDRIDFENNADLNIDGYEYKSAKYTFGYYSSENELTSIEIGREGSIGNRHWYVSFNGGEHQNKNDQPVTINLYYDKVEQGGGGQGGGTVTQNATVTTGKTAVLKNDGSGNYDLTLTVSGDRGTSENKQKVDVLFILDKSGSMTSDRMAQLKSAVNTLVDTVEGNDGIDARYAAVAFAGDGGGNHGSTYTTDTYGDAWRDGTGIMTFVQGISADGGTNYQRAIHEGKTLLNSADDDALTFVVFVSDGIPTYRGNYDDSGSGQSDPNNSNIDAAVEEIKDMSCDYFYAIGMGSDFGQNSWWPYEDKQGTKNLKQLANNVNATSKGDDNVYSASDTQGMQEAFNRITADITHFAAKDVTITDPLSQYADLVLTDGAPQFTITVKHGEQTWTGTVGNNGTVTFQDDDGHDQTATAHVSSDNRTIYLDLPDGYELEEGYTYSISTVITPSRTAKDEGMNSDAAKQTPDDNTGTHSETNPKQQGFWSNDNENAKVTYTANGEDGSKNFPKPVIQVPEVKTGSLTINKEMSGLDEDGTTSKNFTFTIEASNPDNVAGKTFGDAVFDSNGQATVTLEATSGQADADGSVTIEGLPLGAYTVSEISDSVAIDGYVWKGVSYNVENGVVTLSEEVPNLTIVATNTYAKLADIFIDKVDASSPTTLLDGAKFQLKDFSGQVVKLVKEGDVYAVASGDAAGAVESFVVDGELQITGLDPSKTYLLVETGAPEGYNPLPDEITISWDKAGTLNANLSSGSDSLISTVKDHSGHISVPNETGAALPDTGGSGNTPLILGGLLLMAAAGCGYGLRRSRERRGERS